MITSSRVLWLSRFLIGCVMAINVQCALAFLARPDQFAPFYQLSGPVGSAVVQGTGLLFIMWNVPYVLATLNPLRFHVSLFEAVVMQAIGVAGESLILLKIPSEILTLRMSVLRFIIFDAAGLILLLLAVAVLRIPFRLVKQPVHQA